MGNIKRKHERSVTVERDGRFFNISGITGKVLKPQSPFEKLSYKTEAAAVAAARRRSEETGTRGRPSPPGGFGRARRNVRSR